MKLFQKQKGPPNSATSFASPAIWALYLRFAKVSSSSIWMRRPLNPLSRSQRHERKLEQQANQQHPHKKRGNARHQRNQSLRLRLLETEHHFRHDGYKSAKYGNHIQDSYEPPYLMLPEPEVNEPRKKASFRRTHEFGHGSS
jgi:hypothetical protein